MLGFDFSDAESVRNYTDKLLADSDEYFNYHIAKKGFRSIWTELAKFVYSSLIAIINQIHPREQFICGMKHF